MSNNHNLFCFKSNKHEVQLDNLFSLIQDTYATYAELRHKLEAVLRDGSHRAEDIVAQRDYMDTICRSYAARIERRRNLIITSVRFHRLAEEVG